MSEDVSRRKALSLFGTLTMPRPRQLGRRATTQSTPSIPPCNRQQRQQRRLTAKTYKIKLNIISAAGRAKPTS
jgi:hypothetical protein